MAIVRKRKIGLNTINPNKAITMSKIRFIMSDILFVSLHLPEMLRLSLQAGNMQAFLSPPPFPARSATALQAGMASYNNSATQ